MAIDWTTANDMFGLLILPLFNILISFAPVVMIMFMIAVVYEVINDSFRSHRHESQKEKKFDEMREVFDDTERLLKITKEAKEIEKKHSKIWL